MKVNIDLVESDIFISTVNGKHSVVIDGERVIAPSAGNLQSFFIYVVKNNEIKKMLAGAAYGQDFISEAPVVFVFCADMKRSASKYGRRGETLYSIQDATIAATYAMLSIENHGLSSVWVGAFSEEGVRVLNYVAFDRYT